MSHVNIQIPFADIQNRISEIIGSCEPLKEIQVEIEKPDFKSVAEFNLCSVGFSIGFIITPQHKMIRCVYCPAAKKYYTI